MARFASASSRAADRVVATFQDDGAGIRREILPKIFDPFFTTKRPGRGTGLGLSICLAILREHNGEIEAQPLPRAALCSRVRCPSLGVRLSFWPNRGKARRIDFATRTFQGKGCQVIRFSSWMMKKSSGK